jgi:hypothetical protein
LRNFWKEDKEVKKETKNLPVKNLQARNFTNGEIESFDLIKPFFEIPCLSCLQIPEEKKKQP